MSDKKTIIVGLSGGIDSLIAAWLLKRQGHEVIGVSLLFAPEEKESLSQDPQDDEEKKTKPVSFQGIFLIKDVERIKSLCDKIGIPFYMVNARQRYKAEVSDYVISSKLGGSHFYPEVFAVRTIVRTLQTKMADLNADKIATGHYAKLILNRSTGSYNIQASKSAQDDQSFHLAHIQQEALKILELPLSGMRRQEVEKIAANLNLDINHPRFTPSSLMTSKLLPRFVLQQSAPSLSKSGNIHHHMTDTTLGEHPGVHNFYLGEPLDLQEFNIREKIGNEKDLVPASISNKTGTVVLIDKNDWPSVNGVILSRCNFDENNDFSRPRSACLDVNNSQKKYPAIIYFLNNKKIYCELKTPVRDFIFNGDFGVLYDSSDNNAKIIAGGLISQAGKIDHKMKLQTLPDRSQSLLDEEKEVRKKIDIHAFKF